MSGINLFLLSCWFSISCWYASLQVALGEFDKYVGANMVGKQVIADEV